MLSDEQLEKLTADIEALYSELETSVIADMARRIARMGLSPSTEYQARIVAEASGLRSDVSGLISQYGDETQSAIREAFKTAVAESLEYDNGILEAAGYTVNRQLTANQSQVLAANIRKTGRDIRNLTRTTADAAQSSFIKYASLAQLQVDSGAFSYGAAIANAVKLAGGKGAVVKYPSGHVDRLPVAMRRAVLTGSAQTAAAISIDNCEKVGAELVQTSKHVAARPTHAEWQGKIFSLTGSHPRFPSLEDGTGYGRVDGLCGANCRHTFYPYIEGFDPEAEASGAGEIPYHEYDSFEYNGKEYTEYAADQRLKSLKRDEAKANREAAALRASAKENETLAANEPDAAKKADLTDAAKASRDQAALQKAKAKKYQTERKQFAEYVEAAKRPDGAAAKRIAAREAAEKVRLEKAREEAYNKEVIAMQGRIKSGEQKLTLVQNLQNRHIKSSGGYIEGRSYLTVDPGEVQGLVDRFAGTGEFEYSQKEHLFQPREMVTADKIIGVSIRQSTGKETETKSFKIHYSKRGTHIVPKV
jgi:hypothetical protein